MLLSARSCSSKDEPTGEALHVPRSHLREEDAQLTPREERLELGGASGTNSVCQRPKAHESSSQSTMREALTTTSFNANPSMPYPYVDKIVGAADIEAEAGHESDEGVAGGVSQRDEELLQVALEQEEAGRADLHARINADGSRNLVRNVDRKQEALRVELQEEARYEQAKGEKHRTLEVARIRSTRFAPTQPGTTALMYAGSSLDAPHQARHIVVDAANPNEACNVALLPSFTCPAITIPASGGIPIRGLMRAARRQPCRKKYQSLRLPPQAVWWLLEI